MAPTEREARIIFGWTYDDASQKRVEAGLDRVNQAVDAGAKGLGDYSARTQAGLDGVDKAIRRGVQTSMQSREAMANWEKAERGVEGVAVRINAELSKMGRAAALDVIAQDAIQANRGTDQWADQLERVATLLSQIGATDAEIKSVSRAIGQAAKAAQADYDSIPEPDMGAIPGEAVSGSSGGGRRTAGRLGRIGREIRALPAIQLSGSLSTDAIGKILYTTDSALGALGATATQVAAASVIAAPALIGVALAMGEYNRQIDKQRAQLAGALDAQTRYYDGLRTLTSSEAAKEIETERGRLDGLRQQRAEVQNAIDSAFAQAQQAFGDPLARTLEAAGQSPTVQLREQLKTLDAQIVSTEAYTSRLTEGMNNLAFSTNDAAEAAERNADATQQAVDEYTRQQQEVANGQVRAAHLLVQIDGMTATARAARIEALKQEINTLNAAAINTDQSTLAGRLAFTQLGEDIGALNAELHQLSITTKTAADWTAEYNAIQEAQSNQTDAYFEALQKEIAAREKVTKATNDYNDFLAESGAKRRELETENEDKRAEIIDSASDKRAEIEERGAKDRAKIIRDYTKAYTGAVGERDALAARQAKEAAAEKLAEQKASEDESLEKVITARDKQLRSLEKSYEKQQTRLEDAIRREADVRVAAINRAQVDLINSENARAAIAANGAGSQRIIQENFWRDTNAVAVTWASNTVTSLRGIFGVIAQVQGQGLQSGSPAAYDFYGLSGGSNLSSLSIRPATGADGSRGASLVYSPTIYANGLTEKQAEAVSWRVYKQGLQRAGFEQLAGGQ